MALPQAKKVVLLHAPVVASALDPIAWTKVNGFQPTIAMDFARGQYYGAALSDISTTRTTNNTTIDSAGNTVSFSNNQVRISDLGIRYTTDDTMVIGGALATALLSNVGTLLIELGISELVEGTYDITSGPNNAVFLGSAGVANMFVGRGGNGASAQVYTDLTVGSAASNSPGNGINFDTDCQAIALSWDHTAPVQNLTNGGGTINTKSEAFTRSSPINIGRRSDGGAGSGLLRSIRYFPTQITGTDLQALAFYPPSIRKFAGWGDSLMAGAGSSDNAHRWLDVLGNSYNPDAYYFNGGNGGDTSSQVLTRFNADSNAANNRSRINLFWCGHNAVNAAQTVADVQAMVAQLTGEKRYLVLLPVMHASDAVGSSGYVETIATRNALLAAFPGRCVDVPAALAANGDGSTQDNSDIANGYTPTSKSYDGIHLNDAGQAVAETATLTLLNALGW